MRKFRVYVYSVGQVPTTDFVDKEGAKHACAQAGSMPFESLGRFPKGIDGNLISVDEKNAILLVESFCEKNGFKFEVVDFAKLGFLSKVRLRRKGVKGFPSVSFGEDLLCGKPGENDLQALVNDWKAQA